MNLSNTIEIIKWLIKGQAGDIPRTLEYFNGIKGSILALLKTVSPDFEVVDSQSLNSLYDTAVREYISVYPVEMEASASLVKKGFKTWLSEERKSAMPQKYFDRYIRYLRSQGRSEKVIDEIVRSSEQILSKLSDPQSNTAIYTRGLVVGSVQSGKTGNFNAVINRAIDAGFNLIIILSGIMEDLRSQTQLRLEKEVTGEGRNGPIGVGNIVRFGSMGDSSVQQVLSITSPASDFKISLLDAGFSLNNKNLLVCKKNTGVLKNLLVWLSDYLPQNVPHHDIPLLIIDDEADNASLNNLGHKGREYATKINGHIRAILKLFSRATYLGYTATPFANVLQDKNEASDVLWEVISRRNGEIVTRSFEQVGNIYPDDFIELLSPPSNYIGAKQLFNTFSESDEPKIPLVEPITDFINSFPIKVIDESGITRPATTAEIDDKEIKIRSPRKDDPFPKELPESLKDAIECYVIAIAIRLYRAPAMAGSTLYNPHNTMLIHVSRYTDWQNRTSILVQEFVTELAQRIGNDFPADASSIYSKLEKTWNKHYAAIVANIRKYLPVQYADEFLGALSFSDIKPLLPEAVKDIDVRAINNVTKEKLTYNVDAKGAGKKYIAVGGNRLSRGFTLEGLTINYFIRDTNYADTLLQMGRWFGYRPGYIDCCKLFTTFDSIDKFNSTTRTIEELELEFRKMQRQGKTPEDFIIRVWKDPGVLKITRPSILKNTVEVPWSYQDKLWQTTSFLMDAGRIERSWNEIRELFRANSQRIFVSEGTGFYQFDTDINGIQAFLSCANTFHDEHIVELGYINAFLERCRKAGKLLRWRIAVKNARGNESIINAEESGLPGDLRLTNRSGPDKGDYYRGRLIDDGIFTGSGKSANIVTDGRDMALLLSEKESREAEEKFTREKAEELLKNKKASTAEDAKKIANARKRPERIYREQMSDEEGLLIIYPMNLKAVFRESSGDDELNSLKEKRGINTDIPLIGYAIGFPPIDPDPGGKYVRGKYNIVETEDLYEETADEYDAELFDETEDQQ